MLNSSQYHSPKVQNSLTNELSGKESMETENVKAECNNYIFVKNVVI